jgi:DNA-binding transcriptional MerR regulator
LNAAIDQEWVELIATAKQQGLTIEEIRDFLQTEAEGSHKQKTG